MTRHSIGDSHALHGWRYIDGCMIHHLGAITMHRVGRDGLGVLNVAAFNVATGDECFFSFGEIDVRCHIHRQIHEQYRNGHEVLKTLVDRYFDTLHANRLPGVRFVVVSVPPAARFANMPPHVQQDEEYPFVGSDAERAIYAVELNKHLRDRCDWAGFGFLNTHRLAADPQNLLRPEVSDGMYHIKDTALIRKALAEL